MGQNLNNLTTGNIIRQMAHNKALLYWQINSKDEPGGVALVGDSLVEYFPIHELYEGSLRVYNRGVAGNTTHDILGRLDDTVVSLQPKTVILLAGINDFMPFVPHHTTEEIVSRLMQIGKHMKTALPKVKICVQSLYPVNEQFDRGFLNVVNNEAIQTLNQLLQSQCTNSGYVFIDVYPHLLDQSGQLDAHLTLDGIHVNVSAYEVILDLLRPYF
ncbi:MAG: GDSL-type esterase/lipase family protein [Ethanoligenens sp.]